MKKLIVILVAALVVVMMAATIIEKSHGTPFVADNIYGSWWFSFLWGVMIAVSVVYIIKVRLYRRLPIMLLHTSFVVILLGALCTHVFKKSGHVHLRSNVAVNTVTLDEGKSERVPFTMELKSFHMDYYPGTDAPLDYVSDVQIRSDEGTTILQVSMNSIGEYDGYRFCQSGYDTDGNGTILSVQYDPWGIGITYFGYFLFLTSLLWRMFSHHTRIRGLYRKAMGESIKILLPLILLTCFIQNADAEARTIPKNLADNFGHVCMVYNGRVCPANTVATIFTIKLTGKSSWKGLSANEIFTGWIFYFSYWEDVPLIQIKDSVAQRLLGIKGEWASFNDFWNEYNQYKLAGPLREASIKGDQNMMKHLREADEKFNLITMFYHGELLRIYPYPVKEKGKKTRIKWFTPGDENLPTNIPEKEWYFLRKSLDYLCEAIVTGNNDRADVLLGKIRAYQHLRAIDVIPSENLVNAEIVYNTINTQRWPVYVCLAFSILIIVLLFVRKVSSWSLMTDNVLVSLMLLWITTIIILRWIIGEHLPLSNGYETMQFLAWILVVLTLVMQQRLYIVRMCGPLMASLCLLVAMLSEANPQVTQLMPVLQSPLLSIHVMLIMFSYALFALTCVIAITSLLKLYRKKDVEQDTALSQILVYPALACLGIGIFIGAIWANVSWGTYWSWDPKETWALITFMIYAVPLHTASLPVMRKPRVYHIYILCAFLSVIITYFGVNYFMGGMHSYA